jgi:hypothetical protein
MMNESEPRNVTMPADELSTILKQAHQDKQDHSVSCFFQSMAVMGGLLMFSLSIAVWINWIL